jgi:hypothetical protein
MHDMSVLLLPILVILNRTVFAEGEDRPSKERTLFRTASVLFVSQLCMSFAPEHFYIVAIPIMAFALFIPPALLSVTVKKRRPHSLASTASDVSRDSYALYKADS